MNQHEIIPAKTDVGALANRINLETRQLHNAIDKMVTLKFAIAVRDAKIYRQGIQMFYHIFSAIEESLEREMARDTKYSEVLKQVYKPVMLRKQNLYNDLMYFYHDDESKFEKPILDKQIEFSNHIKKCTADKPYLLLAYMHVLYLALFAGGRIMSSQVARSLRLFPQTESGDFNEFVSMGTNFYRFEGYDNDLETLRILYKRDYELATRNFLSEDEKLEIIDESKLIFSKVGEGVKEIESHNLNRIKSNLLYQLASKGYYFLILLMVFIVYKVVTRMVL